MNHAELLARVAELEPDAVCTDRPHELRAESIELPRTGRTLPEKLAATA